MISGLKTLDCGLYLMTKKTTDITKIVKLNNILKNITNTMIVYREFKDIVKGIISIIESEIKVKSINLCIKDENDIVSYSEENQYRGTILTKEKINIDIIKLFSSSSKYREENLYLCKENSKYIIPIYLKNKEFPSAIISIDLDSNNNYEILEIIAENIKTPLEVSIERELIFRQMDKERIKTYERSIRDPLTNLFTRIYMNDIMKNYFYQNDRNNNLKIAGIMVDIDHFKKVNDVYGHMQGDIALKAVAKIILDSARKSDIPIRFGGEEFIIFTIGEDVDIVLFSERLRKKVSLIKFNYPMENHKITASFGCAVRNQAEEINESPLKTCSFLS